MEPISLKVNSPAKKYVAFFDLDRTIISTNSGKLLTLQGYKHGLLSWIDIIKGLYFSLLYRLQLKDSNKIIDSMVGWVKGVKEISMINLSEEIFKNQIKQTIHSEVFSEIEFHKKNGGFVVLLSSAIYPICQQVADHLKMDDIICSKLECVDGVYNGQPEGRLCFREEKVKQLIEYCNKNGLNQSDSWYYGDSIDDLPVLSTVGIPVCVNPDKKLRVIASEKGWLILRWG